MPDEANHNPDRTAQASSRSTTVHSEEGRPHLCQPDGSSPEGREMPFRRWCAQESQLCNAELPQQQRRGVDEQALDEKTTIAELVLAASKTKHVVEPIQPWLLSFRDESIGHAYESRQVGAAFTAVTFAVVFAILGGTLRLTRVALGTETAPGAYEAHQIWLFVVVMAVHLCIGGCAFYVRNSQLLHTRRILTMATISAITAAIWHHAVTKDIFMADQCAPVEVWIFAVALAFAVPTLTFPVIVWVRPFIGCIMLQPMLASPHLEAAVAFMLAFLLAGMTACACQAEKSRRLAFLHELELLSQCRKSAAENSRIERQLAQSTAEEQIRLHQASRVEAEASRARAEATQRRQCEIEVLQVVNHSAKRTMLNTNAWLEKLEELRPSAEVREILKQIGLETQTGIEMCAKFSRRRELKSGVYTNTPTLTDLVEVLKRSARRLKVSIDVVHEGVPRLLLVDEALAELVFDNGVDNAQQHGLHDGEIQITLRVDSNNMVLTVTNKPGPNHDRNKALQVQRGENSMIRDCDSNGQYWNQIGCNDSTFRGLSEIKRAAQAMDACATLKFRKESVEFSFAMQMVQLGNESEPTELPMVDQASAEMSENESATAQLPEGTVFVCADDDLISRMMLKKMFIKLPGLNADQKNSIVLGETLQEAQGLVQTVIDLAAQFGERRVICILDQNMDNYGTGTVLGTDVTIELRSLGFKGTILIRSANGDRYSRQWYQDAGVSGFLAKNVRKGPEIVECVTTAWYNTNLVVSECVNN